MAKEVEEYLEDPELGDDSDPTYREEMFETFYDLGKKPEDLGPEWAADYKKWLETYEPDEE